MRIGYVRVSTHEQHEDLQLDALNQASCEKLFTDKSTGARFERSGLEAALASTGRETPSWCGSSTTWGAPSGHLIETLNDLNSREVGFVSLTESIDTTTTVHLPAIYEVETS